VIGFFPIRTVEALISRAREIPERMEETMQAENGQQQTGSTSIWKGKVIGVIEGKRKYLPRKLRIKAYHKVIELRQQGLSYNKIRAI
jgi:hypothetical protein